MSYTPRFGEYIYAKDTFENTDTRWIIAEFAHPNIQNGEAGSDKYKYYIDNFGNVIGQIIKNPLNKVIEISARDALKYYEPVTEQYDIPLSDELILTLKCHPLIRRYGVRHPNEYCASTTISILNLVKSLAPSHYKNYQELQALKQRMQTLEEKLSRSLTPFDVESHVFSTTPFDDFRPVRITTTHCSKSGLF